MKNEFQVKDKKDGGFLLTVVVCGENIGKISLVLRCVWGRLLRGFTAAPGNSSTTVL